MQAAAARTPTAVPMLVGNDSVHGQNNLANSTLYPHHIALGCMRDASGAPDEETMEKLASMAAAESYACGVNWMFSPCVAVPQDVRWGRTYEVRPPPMATATPPTTPHAAGHHPRGRRQRWAPPRAPRLSRSLAASWQGFSEDTEIVAKLGAAEVRGIQRQPFPMAACVKHWVADGGTRYGSGTSLFFWSGAPIGVLDQGDAVLEEAELRQRHIGAYLPALADGALTVMATYSSWNGQKVPHIVVPHQPSP